MMDFTLTDDQIALRDEIAEFAREHVTDDLKAELHESGTGHSPSLWQAMAERGYLAMGWPTEHGGQGRTQIEMAIVKEELYYSGAPMWTYTTTLDYVSRSIMAYGSDAQKAEFIPRVARGQLVFCFSLTEPNAGSDAASITTRAVRVDGGYRITGSKIFTSNAHLADYALVVARTTPGGKKHEGITLFLLPLKDHPHITIRNIPTMAGHADTCEVHFDEVYASDETVIGDVDQGWQHLTATLDLQRSAQDVGGMRRTLDDLRAWLRAEESTWTSGRRERARQHVARLSAKLDAARMLSYRVAWLQSQGQHPNVEASHVKLYCTTLQQELIDGVLEIVGAAGDVEWTPGQGLPPVIFNGRLANLYRSTAILTIGGGSREIQLTIIARRGLGLPSK